MRKFGAHGKLIQFVSWSSFSGLNVRIVRHLFHMTSDHPLIILCKQNAMDYMYFMTMRPVVLEFCSVCGICGDNHHFVQVIDKIFLQN